MANSPIPRERAVREALALSIQGLRALGHARDDAKQIAYTRALDRLEDDGVEATRLVERRLREIRDEVFDATWKGNGANGHAQLPGMRALDDQLQEVAYEQRQAAREETERTKKTEAPQLNPRGVERPRGLGKARRKDRWPESNTQPTTKPVKASGQGKERERPLIVQWRDVVAKLPTIPLSAKGVALIVATFMRSDGSCVTNPGMELLRELAGTSLPTIRTALRKLEAAGLLRIARRWTAKGHRAVSEYRAVLPVSNIIPTEKNTTVGKHVPSERKQAVGKDDPY